MARMTVNGSEILDRQLNKLGKPMIRKIVEAGADAATRRMQGRIQERGHIRTGDMLKSVGPTAYREFYGGGAQMVYPQGDDRQGVRNATKAYVINYGRGGTRRRGKMGDRFITGDEKKTEEAVREAMMLESSRLLAELKK